MTTTEEKRTARVARFARSLRALADRIESGEVTWKSSVITTVSPDCYVLRVKWLEVPDHAQATP